MLIGVATDVSDNAGVDRTFYAMGAVLALLGVALGAFGAHGLRGKVTPDLLEVYETAVRYQMYHALGIFAVAWACARWPTSPPGAAAWLFLAGIVIFSGSLYLLVLTGQRWLGAITPLGGLAFLLGWAVLAWRVLVAR
jgi:uncharacterized membrane protein YgdD (TMEM256/DUF423 family)